MDLINKMCLILSCLLESGELDFNEFNFFLYHCLNLIAKKSPTYLKLVPYLFVVVVWFFWWWGGG